MDRPVPGKVSSPFGTRRHPKEGTVKSHKGVDIAVRTGTPVRATGSGKVIAAGFEDKTDAKKGHGLRVIIDHGNGNISLYAHLSRQDVKENDTVKEGQVIGKSGNTGASTGPHLHYAELHKGKAHPPTGKPGEYKP